MDRKEFLSLMGGSAATIIFAGCLAGCQKSSSSGVAAAPSNVDFTLDLSTSAYANLNTNGGYIYNQGVIVARTTSGDFIAVSQNCTHETYRLTFDGARNQFFCPNHGATFTTTGSVSNGPARQSLAQYKTSLQGNMLRVYS
ncbi:MAG: Rieske (2Fe-2S) protein [Daejeonella sp.]